MYAPDPAGRAGPPDAAVPLVHDVPHDRLRGDRGGRPPSYLKRPNSALRRIRPCTVGTRCPVSPYPYGCFRKTSHRTLSASRLTQTSLLRLRGMANGSDTTMTAPRRRPCRRPEVLRRRSRRGDGGHRVRRSTGCSDRAGRSGWCLGRPVRRQHRNCPGGVRQGRRDDRERVGARAGRADAAEQRPLAFDGPAGSQPLRHTHSTQHPERVADPRPRTVGQCPTRTAGRVPAWRW